MSGGARRPDADESHQCGPHLYADRFPIVPGGNGCARAGGDAGVQRILGEEAHRRVRKGFGVVRDQEIFPMREIEPLRAFGCGDDRRSERHRFQNLQPGAAALTERHDADAARRDIRANVRQPAGEGDPRRRGEAIERDSLRFPRDGEPGIGDARADTRQDMRREVGDGVAVRRVGRRPAIDEAMRVARRHLRRFPQGYAIGDDGNPPGVRGDRTKQGRFSLGGDEEARAIGVERPHEPAIFPGRQRRAQAAPHAGSIPDRVSVPRRVEFINDDRHRAGHLQAVVCRQFAADHGVAFARGDPAFEQRRHCGVVGGKE